ncbi:hypothetical protein THRCLA_05078 [Thraustotheca clavata]|uniref:Amine oxidase domain-containing protein n=1 Tax=Thraustotheca clavata TaxID=74557 RepID=A0A1V9ZXN9_9STRA|nr:hypothetical protein THRCLA_05078 [Thraustotheca clavata]
MKIITSPESIYIGLFLASLPLLYYFLKPSKKKTIVCVPVEFTDEELIKQGFTAKRVPDHIDVVVIGSGIGGLTVASVLAQEGKKVLVLEQHDVAGGNLHTFEEKGYEFDTGLHYIGGNLDDKKRPSRKIFDYLSNDGIEWQRLGDIVDLLVAEGPNQARDNIAIESSQRALCDALKKRFPDEHGAIDSFFKIAKEANGTFQFIFGLQFVPQWLRGAYRWWFSKRLRYLKTTTTEVLDKLTTNQALKGIMSYAWGDFGEPPSRSTFMLTAALINHYRGGAYYPIGGPSVIAKKLTRVIESYGGKVLVRAPVSSLLVSPDGAAMGVVVKDVEVYAPIVVSAVGAPTTYKKLIPEPHRFRVQHYVNEFDSTSQLQSQCSLMSLFIGFEGSDIELPQYNVWKYPSWNHDANFAANQNGPDAPFCAVFMSFPSAKDPTYAARHPNRHVAIVIGSCFYKDVEAYKDGRVKHRGAEYEALKAKWQERLLGEFLKEFPSINKSSIKFTELGTALTNDYYLGNYKGAIYGLGHTPERFQSDIGSPRTPIKNLYLSGQDVMSCGIVGAMFGGLTTAAVISPSFFKRLGGLMRPS